MENSLGHCSLQSPIKLFSPSPPSNLLCPLCKSEVDSLPHLFFCCIFSRVPWRSSFWPLDSLFWSNIPLASWIKGIPSPHISFGILYAEAHLFQIFAAVLCDLLWFSRNKAAHDGIIPGVMVLANSIKKTALEHSAAWKIDSQPVLEIWSPTSIGVFKINFDTTIRENLFA
jgi:hypothetical protein